MLFIRQERLRRGWSLARVTQLTGIAGSDLSAVERGVRPAYPGWRRRLADAFERPEEQLFSTVDEEEAVPA